MLWLIWCCDCSIFVFMRTNAASFRSTSSCSCSCALLLIIFFALALNLLLIIFLLLLSRVNGRSISSYAPSDGQTVDILGLTTFSAQSYRLLRSPFRHIYRCLRRTTNAPIAPSMVVGISVDSSSSMAVMVAGNTVCIGVDFPTDDYDTWCNCTGGNVSPISDATCVQHCHHPFLISLLHTFAAFVTTVGPAVWCQKSMHIIGLPRHTYQCTHVLSNNRMMR